MHGYEEFMIVVANPNDANYQQFKTWYGRDFDPTMFDIRSARRIFMMLDHYGRGYPWKGWGIV